MKTESKKLPHDVKESILSIENYIGDNKDFTIYQENKMLRWAVEREIEIIGEALNKLRKTDPESTVNNMDKIISMRNRVIHSYDSVDNEIIWGVINRHIPNLKIEV